MLQEQRVQTGTQSLTQMKAGLREVTGRSRQAVVLHGQDCACFVTCSTLARLTRKTCHSARVSYGGPNKHQQHWQQQQQEKGDRTAQQ